MNRYSALILLTLFAVISGTEARVFTRKTYANRTEQLKTAQPSWSCAYQARYLIDGKKTELSVFATGESLSSSLRSLKHSMSDLSFCRSGKMALGLSVDASSSTRILATSEWPGGCLLFLIEEQNQQEKKPTLLLKELAVLSPTLQFSADNLDTGTRFQQMNSPNDASFCAATMSETLQAGGWQDPFMSTGTAAPAGCQVFIKNRQLCIVAAQKAGQKPSSSITLILKPILNTAKP